MLPPEPVRSLMMSLSLLAADQFLLSAICSRQRLDWLE